MKIRTKILGGFFIIIALTLFLGITVFLNTSEVSDNFTFLVKHDLEVLQNAQKLQKLVVDAETGQRGFIITGKESFLEPYNKGITGFNSLIEIEKQLVSDNPSQVQRLENIQLLFDEWKLKAAQPEIAAARQFHETDSNFQVLEIMLSKGVGKNILDSIRDEFTIFIQIENDLKDERLSKVTTTSIFTETLLILLPISITAVAMIIAFFFTQSISRPLEILKLASVKVSGGNLDTKIQQVSMEKRKTASAYKSNLKSANQSKKIGFKNKILAVFLLLSLLIGVIGFVSYIEIIEVQDDLSNIADFQTPALIKLNEMKAAILEGIEEAFAYPLLDAVIEKEEFYENMNRFDLLTEEFVLIAHIGEVDEQIETQLLNKIILTKERLVDSATIMFEDYESSRKISVLYLELFEQDIDTLIPLIDEFIDIEIEEVNEAHLHAQQNINATFLTLPIIILSAVLVSVLGGIVVSRTITEPMVIISSADEKLMKEHESGISSSGDEIKELSDTFNIMVDSIKAKIELEKKVSAAETRLKSEKLSTVGALASRIAHDLRNPLTAIKLSHDLIKIKRPPEDEYLKKRYDVIDSSIARMSHQLDNVLDFVRTRTLQLERSSLEKIIDLTISSLNIPENITIQKTGNDVSLTCDPQLIQVVVENLLQNAIHVLENEGEIKIRIFEKDDNVILELEDSGSGIPEKDLETIFEPLFTTKQEGTGLGLSSCKSIVSQHKGTISVRNNPTVFTITLPKELNL